MDIRESPLLEHHKDPFTGAVQYKLKNLGGRIQNNFYFTVPSTTSDNRFLSVVSSDPAEPGQNLWIADFEKSTFRPLTTKGFAIESMILDEARGKIWYARDGAVYGQDFEDEVPDRAELLFRFPEEVAKGRKVEWFSNHITYNHDGSRFAYCGCVNRTWYVGFYDLGEKRHHIVHESVIKSTHVQFAPDSSNNILFCHDWWVSPETGRQYDWDHRLWLYTDSDHTVRETYMIEHEQGPGGNVEHRPFHEFWSRDGGYIYLCDMPHGVVRHNPADPEHFELVWPGLHCHAHCDGAGTRFVSDINPYGWGKGEPAHVAFLNAETGKEGYIAYNLPPAPGYAFQRKFGRHYHSHPHPTFTQSEDYILFTGTMGGELNVFLVYADDIFV